MNENFLHFKSETPCLISINGENVGIIDNINTFEIDILSKCNNMYITYLPTSDNSTQIQYTFNLNTYSTPYTNNNNVTIVPFPNNHFDIIMSPIKILSVNINTKTLLNKKIDDFFVNIITDHQTDICIYSEMSIVYKNRIPKIQNCKIEKIKDNLVITGYIDVYLYYLLIIETKSFTEKFSDFSHSIENTDGIVQSFKRLNNIERSAQVTKFDLNNNNEETFFVYEFDRPKYPSHELLIPKAFLEAIKIKDTNYMLTLLSNKYHSTDLNKFGQFFGQYEHIYLNTHEYKQNNINYSIKSRGKFKNYNFIINNGKIEEIEEIF